MEDLKNLLHINLEQARQGMLWWNALVETEMLTETDCLIFFPEFDDEINREAIKYIHEYIFHIKAKRTFVFYCDPGLAAKIPSDFNEIYKVAPMSPEEMNAFMKFFCLVKIHPGRFAFISLDRPEWSWGRRPLERNAVSLEHVVKYGVFKLPLPDISKKQRTIPNYRVEILANLKSIDMNGKNVVIFPANDVMLDVIYCLAQNGITSYKVVDNDPKKQGIKYGNTFIASPKTLKNYNQMTVILVATKYYNEIKLQLERWGYRENKTFFQVVKIGNPFQFHKISTEKFESHTLQSIKAFDLYKSIIDKYGTGIKIYLSLANLGDVFLCTLYFKKHLAHYNINHYTMLIPRNISVDIARWQGVEFVEEITPTDARLLSKLCLLVGFEKLNVTFLQTFSYWGTSIWYSVLLSLGSNLLDNYRECLLLPPGTQNDNPSFTIDEKYVKTCFEENRLKQSQTVILSPYANSLRPIYFEFWERLAISLSNMGYTVATNVCNETEAPVKNTIPFYFSIKDTIGILEYAGFFIALRSGLCDIAAYAKCKKIILYPDDMGHYMSVFDLFSLNKMGLCDDANELVYDFNNPDNDLLLKNILNIFDSTKTNSICGDI